ncbi:MAG: IclR family transcriptional regulator [Pseudomonadota bacterium]
MDKTQTPRDEVDRYLVPGLARGLMVLQAFSPERREMSLSEIAGHLGTTRSAAFRTVYTLTHLGYLLHDARKKTYALGPAVLRLGYGYLATRELVEAALPELERLRDAIDWSTHLGMRDGSDVIYMLRAPSRTGLSGIVQVGSRLPAAVTAMGRMLLCAMSEAELTSLYRNDQFFAGAGRSPRNLSELIAQWSEDRARGYVVQHGRFESGVLSIAAPIHDLSGSMVAAINAARLSGADIGADRADRPVVSGSVVSGSAVPGSAPPGSAPTGSALPGSAPSGSAPFGSAPSGSAQSLALGSVDGVTDISEECRAVRSAAAEISRQLGAS